MFKIVDCVDAGPFNALVAEARGGAGFIPTSQPAIEPPGMGPIAITTGIGAEPRLRPVITSGRQPPTPPEPLIDSELEPPPIESEPDSPGKFDMPF